MRNLNEYLKLNRVIPKEDVGSHWHKNGNYYEYILYSDNNIYQRRNGALVGVFCSGPAWERNLHKVLG